MCSLSISSFISELKNISRGSAQSGIIRVVANQLPRPAKDPKKPSSSNVTRPTRGYTGFVMSEHRERSRVECEPTAPYSKRYALSHRTTYRRWVAPAVVIGLVGLIVALLASAHVTAALAVVVVVVVVVANRR